MRICWDNLEGLYLTRNGFLRKNNTTYVEKCCCKKCGEAYLTPHTRESDYCSISCLKKSYVVSENTKKKISEAMTGEKHPWFGRKHSKKSIDKMKKSSTGKKHTEKSKLKMSVSRLGNNNHFYGKHHTEESKDKISRSNIGKNTGESNSAYKGGVKKLNIPLYNTYSKQIDWCEETRCILQNGLEILQVRCTNSGCKKWYTPSISAVTNRIQTLKGNYGGNNRFYCSEECKYSCSIHNKSINSMVANNLNYTNYELKIWRNVVLKRENYICEYCGDIANTAHHILPKKTHTFYALDPDNGIACCQKCHNKKAHEDLECSYHHLASLICK